MGKRAEPPRNGKVALVTGGAIRVGRAISLGLARAGFDVAINYHSSEAEAQATAAEITGLGRRCLLVRGDVADADDVARIVGRVGEGLGRLDLLVNNASIFGAGRLLELDESEWDRVLAVNLKGPFLMVKEAAAMLEDSGGSIVNIVDVSALEAWTGYPHHSVSKAGLLHLTRLMAKALAPRVRVNAVAPGSVLPPEGTDETERERLRRKTLVGRLGSPEDVVRTVLFLERSPFITGELIVVDGGRSVR